MNAALWLYRSDCVPLCGSNRSLTWTDGCPHVHRWRPHTFMQVSTPISCLSWLTLRWNRFWCTADLRKEERVDKKSSNHNKNPAKSDKNPGEILFDRLFGSHGTFFQCHPDSALQQRRGGFSEIWFSLAQEVLIGFKICKNLSKETVHLFAWFRGRLESKMSIK